MPRQKVYESRSEQQKAYRERRNRKMRVFEESVNAAFQKLFWNTLEKVSVHHIAADDEGEEWMDWTELLQSVTDQDLEFVVIDESDEWTKYFVTEFKDKIYFFVIDIGETGTFDIYVYDLDFEPITSLQTFAFENPSIVFRISIHHKEELTEEDLCLFVNEYYQIHLVDDKRTDSKEIYDIQYVLERDTPYTREELEAIKDEYQCFFETNEKLEILDARFGEIEF